MGRGRQGGEVEGGVGEGVIEQVDLCCDPPPHASSPVIQRGITRQLPSRTGAVRKRRRWRRKRRRWRRKI